MKTKRLVSVLLVLLMLGSMIPAGFANSLVPGINPQRPSGGGTPAHMHNFGEWRTVREPTCTEEGLMESQCSGCGLKGQKKIDKIPHDYTKWEITVEPTADSAGEEQRTCKMCGKVQTRSVDPTGNPDRPRDEDTSAVSLVPRPEIESGIEVTKTVISTPGGGRPYYTKNEVIDYLIEVKNTGNTIIVEAVIYDSVNGGPSTEIASIDNFYPSSTRQYYYHYTVTEADVSAGFATVRNSAFAVGTDEYYNGVYGEDSAESRVGPDETEPQRPYVTKEVVNKPKNGSFFVEDEQIDFEIIVHNPGELDIVYAAIQDGFNAGPLIWIASVVVPAHTDSVPVPYSHIVTAEEAAAGKVTNLAIADCNLSDYSFLQIGDEAEALTGVETAETGSEAFSDCCVRTLTGKGEGIAEYTLSYCHVHEPIAGQVKALLAAAGENPDESVWQQAAELWRAAIDEEYARLNATDEYKNAFYTWLEAYEACLKAEYPEDTAQVAMRISEQLMNYCADLCYLIGTAPADRADSMLTGRYETLAAAEAVKDCFRAVTDGQTVSYAEILCEEHRAADTELMNALKAAKTGTEQAEAFSKNKQSWLNALSMQAAGKLTGADAETSKTVLQERNAFGKMLQAEESFLTAFYPGRPEVVQEMLANTVREHVIDFCE